VSLLDVCGPVASDVPERARLGTEIAIQPTVQAPPEHRADDSRGDDQAHPVPGKNAQRAVPPVAQEPGAARASGDQEAGQGEEPRDTQTAQVDREVKGSAAGAVADDARMADDDGGREYQPYEVERVVPTGERRGKGPPHRGTLAPRWSSRERPSVPWSTWSNGQTSIPTVGPRTMFSLDHASRVRGVRRRRYAPVVA